MTRRFALVVGLSILMAGAAPRATQDLTREDADSMQRKIAAILGRGELPATANAAPVRTAFSEREVNAYFKFVGPDEFPPGVVDPRVRIAEGGRIEGRAVVDLDAVRKSKERGWLDPLTYVTGAVEVRASGTLLAANGVGVFKLASATLGGVTIPKALLQELVTFYTRTPEAPNGFALDDPFTLPAAIRAVQLQRGAATVIQ